MLLPSRLPVEVMIQFSMRRDPAQLGGALMLVEQPVKWISASEKNSTRHKVKEHNV